MATRRGDVMARLSLANLGETPPSARPPVDPRAIETGIVHLGLGAFHRAHQAVFTQAAMAAAGDTRWGICGVTQRSRDVIDQLADQDGLYSVLQRGDQTSISVLAPIRELLFAKTQAADLTARIATPSTQVVTLTVTEKGYRHDPATGRLQVADAETQADVEGHAPQTVVGQLVRGIQARSRLGAGPLTVVCCDNLPSNGRTLARLVADFCGLLPAAESASTLAWIESFVRFPCTMVDRIVPATTAADRAEAARLLGVEDEGVVVAEPFAQWVIEDSFATARPAWELAGAVITDDVTPYEAMKLRLLNGSHSAIAYLGALAGYDYVADFVRVGEVAVFVRALMDFDVTPTLAVPAGFDVVRYKEQLLERFGNHALRHRTSQIAIDGTQKLPQRLLGVVADRRSAGATAEHAVLAVAAWMRYVSAPANEQGVAIVVDDPLAEVLARRLAGARDAATVVDRLLGIEQVFSPQLRDDRATRSRLVDYVEALAGKGVLATLRELA
ncbi:MAG TPA: mannitol dehydrogenase family protein [Acidothermaceae bacterium]